MARRDQGGNEKARERKDFVAGQVKRPSGSSSKTIAKTRRFTRVSDVVQSEGEDLADLVERLEPIVLDVTECFDASHVSNLRGGLHGQVRSGSRSTELQEIHRSFQGNDDFRAMEEVMERRYGRLLREGARFPDLVVVDGGEGQVSSAKGAFVSLGCPLPPLIGLAKREETIVFSDGREGLKLNARSPALRLLQRLRDEAHRFANQFNADLRSRRIRESVLDDFSGLGEVRKKALLGRFGSIEKLKKASVEDLSSVEGIGPKIAQRLNLFLRKGKSS